MTGLGYIMTFTYYKLHAYTNKFVNKLFSSSVNYWIQ